MKTYILDTETTGNEPPECIELAYMDAAIGPLSNYIRRFKPTYPSGYGALAVHHILPYELDGESASADARMPEDATYIIGHNIDYDWKVLGQPAVKRICTLAIARALYPECDSHKLGAMYYRVCGITDITRNYLRDAHSAVADVQFCYEILLAMLADRAPQHSLDDVEALWKFSEQCRIPTHMTFGKHKGDAIALVPRAYVDWYRRQPDTDPYLLQAFKAAGK